MNDRANLPVVREDFTGTQSMAIVETAASAAAAQAKALVEARYIMALRRPRSWDQVRQDILKECRRPSFAHNKSAFYRKPIGDGVEGLGIRFAEVALRCMTNVTIDTTTTFSDAMQEIVKVTITDLESNVPYALDVPISKTVERRKPNDDGSYLSVRKNSWGKDVYTVIGNDEDLLNKRGALISKALRTLALRLIPGDIQDEAEETIKAIRLDQAAKDPGAERKKIADAFGELNVKATDLQEYLGHSLDNCSPQELVNLRGLYSAIRDGEATWAQVMENKADTAEDKKQNGVKPQPTLPVLADDAFAKKLPGWRSAIAGGKSADEVIAMIQTKNQLTPEQVTAIRAPAADENAPASDEDLEAFWIAAGKAEISRAEVMKHLDLPVDAVLTLGQLPLAMDFIADPAAAAKKKKGKK